MASLASGKVLSRLQHASRHSALPFLYPYNPTHCARRAAMMSAFNGGGRAGEPGQRERLLKETPPTVIPADNGDALLSPDAAAPQTAAKPPPPPKVDKPRPKIRATKAALTITPNAVTRLQGLMKGPTPKLIRIGVRNKGCAGLSYHLDYVEKPERFDEIVEQDGVRVCIDSKALFSIIGSEMDWQEDALSAKFAFKNPNIKDACGCGESFNVAPTL